MCATCGAALVAVGCATTSRTRNQTWCKLLAGYKAMPRICNRVNSTTAVHTRMSDPRLPRHQPDTAAPVPALGAIVWAQEHGPVPRLNPATVLTAGLAPLGSTQPGPEGTAHTGLITGMGGGSAQNALQPVPTRSFSGRVFGVAALCAAVLHGVVLVCLLANRAAIPPTSAPGEKSVQMVFETHASAPPPPAAVPAPQPVANNTPPMPMDDTPPPVAPPPVPLATETLPDVPLFKPLPPRQVQAHKHTMPPMQHGAKPAPTGEHAPTANTQPQAVAPDGALAVHNAPAPASAEHAAKGGSVTALRCTPPQTHYPAMARRLHEEGEAVVEVSLAATGAVQAVKLVQSTGYDDLDAQALTAARALRCTPPEAATQVGRIPVGFHIH